MQGKVNLVGNKVKNKQSVSWPVLDRFKGKLTLQGEGLGLDLKSVSWPVLEVTFLKSHKALTINDLQRRNIL